MELYPGFSVSFPNENKQYIAKLLKNKKAFLKLREYLWKKTKSIILEKSNLRKEKLMMKSIGGKIYAV